PASPTSTTSSSPDDTNIVTRQRLHRVTRRPLGNYQQDEWGGGALDDRTCVPRAQAAADLMTAGIRSALTDEGSEVLGLDDMEARLIAEVNALPTRPHRESNDELIAEIRAEAFNRLRANAG
ncbi:hypothetical protein, partial [Micromonospora sp. NPDC000442]|uniref:hypothetical protein n=1 Tax=Micromonospora sp. NPDC000442 TaxID=3364217 RepID=UPI003677F7D7